MGKNSAIEWCDHTFNPWLGCTKVSPGCERCYAEHLMDTRLQRVNWGRGNPRQRTSVLNWKQPFAWDREAALAGAPARVFCASLADVFDAEVPDQWRMDVFNVMRGTPNLLWLLLTKRPAYGVEQVAVWREIDPQACGRIWFGVSAENQEWLNRRAEYLTDIRLAEITTFVSAEPLLGQLDLAGWEDYIDWVIVGGESGKGARPMNPDWVRDIRDQCVRARIPFFFKQWGGVRKALAGKQLDGAYHLDVPQGTL
jgi:protein gp37